MASKRNKKDDGTEEKSYGSGMQYPEYHISNKTLKLFAANSSNLAQKREFTRYIRKGHHR